MHRPAITLAFAGMLAVSACGVLGSGQRSEPEPDYDDPDYGDYRDTGYGSASGVAQTACREEIVRRWRVPESRVRTTGRSTNADGESLVNWEIQDGATGYCRVDANGSVGAVEVERTRDERTGGYDDRDRDRGDDDDFDGTPNGDDDFGSREVRRSQLRACRDEIVRRLDVRASDVAMSAGELDDRQMAYIEWNVNNGRSGSCLVDRDDEVVRFRTR